LGELEVNGFSPEDLPGICLQIGFDMIDLSADDSSTYHKLRAIYHKDPFDRMLIWQSIRNKYPLISADDMVKQYKSERLKIFSE
jgi:PIN domain nuclease of toxin-antitoxin system